MPRTPLTPKRVRAFVPARAVEPALLLLLALLVRIAVIGAFHENLAADPDAYGQLAQNVALQGEFSFGAGRPTAFRPPLYPVLLAPLAGKQGVSRTGVAALHVGLGLLTVLGTWTLARRWMTSRTARLLAALLVACDPLLLYQSTYVMTEVCATALTVLTLWSLDRWWQRPSTVEAAMSGTSLALCTLCRPTFAIWLPLVLAWMVGAAEPSTRRRSRWWSATIAGLAFGAVMTPWWLRNYEAFGQPIWTTTHGGYTLWLANNDFFYDYLSHADRPTEPWSSAAVDEMQRRLSRELNFDEIALDRALEARAWATIRSRPGLAIYSSWWRLGQFWNPMPQAVAGRPSGGLVRATIAVWYLGQFTLVVLGATRLVRLTTWRRWIPALALVVALSAVHTIYWSNPRMRTPLAPSLVLWAALGAEALERRRTQAT